MCALVLQPCFASTRTKIPANMQQFWFHEDQNPWKYAAVLVPQIQYFWFREDEFENALKHVLGRETQFLGTQHRVWVVAASFNKTSALDVGLGGGTLQAG